MFDKSIVSKSVLDAFMKARQEEYLKTFYTLLTIPELRAKTNAALDENESAWEALKRNPSDDRKENVRKLEFFKNRKETLEGNLKNLSDNEKNLSESMSTLVESYKGLKKATGYGKFSFFSR